MQENPKIIDNAQFSQIERKCGDILPTRALDTKHNHFLALSNLIIISATWLIGRPIRLEQGKSFYDNFG